MDKEKRRPHIIMFYSYKGGTGRTTTAANVAAILAYNGSKGKNVLLLDLDFDGPGMSLVLGTEKMRSHALQEYIDGRRIYDGPEGWIQDVRKVRLESGFPIGGCSENGRLLLLPSHIGYEHPVDVREAEAVRLDNLITLLIEDPTLNLDYIIIDGASGYSDAATLGLRVADYVFVMMRLSYQHVIGSISIVQFVKMTSAIRPSMDFMPVAMIIPPIHSAGEETLKEYYIDLIGENFGKKPLEVAEIHTLKWEERILLFDKDAEMVRETSAFLPLIQSIESYVSADRSHD